MDEKITYKKPFYDPFDIFKPSKSLLLKCIKQWQVQCYKLIGEGNEDEWAKYFNQKELDELNKKINDYKWRIKNSGAKGTGSSSRISQIEIQRAKDCQISNFYTGQLRRAGKNLLGLCPWQPGDKHPSFTIFENGRRYKCFSCGESGDSIDFIQKQQSITFHQAIKYILKI